MIKLSFKKKMHTPQGIACLEVDLTVPQGELASVFGASGAGKTTLLRVLAGLTTPEEGYIKVDGEIWFDSTKQINLPANKRAIGFVFQESSLFPHMTVRENVHYALKDGDDQRRVDEWMAVVGLKGLENQRPDKLSGGQKQRTALARALIRNPKILLLDEPLSDLDAHARLQLQDEIINVYRRTHITTILVSHDLSEVFKLSQKVFVLQEGKVTKSGSPHDVFITHDLSGKFKFTGEIIAIHKDGILNIVTLNIGNQLARVVASDEELAGLTVGSKVVVAAKAFNPLLLKL